MSQVWTPDLHSPGPGPLTTSSLPVDGISVLLVASASILGVTNNRALHAHPTASPSANLVGSAKQPDVTLLATYRDSNPVLTYRDPSVPLVLVVSPLGCLQRSTTATLFLCRVGHVFAQNPWRTPPLTQQKS